MCGIAGTINIQFTKDQLQVIQHRGPDSMGLHEEKYGAHTIYFGHTRLAIVDLTESGSQPMTDDTGNYTIVLNGEIYNQDELRKSLPEVKFKGHSDTEVVLYFLAKFGIKAIDQLNGIFAFAFFDKKAGMLHLARDPYGIKPLYYYFNNETLVFSSEMRFIKELITSDEINLDCLYTYLRLRFCPSPLTLIKDVFKVNPGHAITVNLNNNRLEKTEWFYSFIPVKLNNITEEEAMVEYDRLLRKAIEKQLMSDVPIAIMLSGGVDSALMAYLAQEVSEEKFDTFTVGYDIKTLSNELKDAAITAKWLGSLHHQIIISQSGFHSSSADFVRMVEEPVGSQSLYPFYKLTEGIHASGFKVALSGQGVDEGWAGYKRYNFQNFFDKYSSPFWKGLNFVNLFLKSDKLRRGINALTEKNRTKRFIESYSFFEKKTIDKMMNTSIQFDDEYEVRLLNLINSKANLYQADKMNGLDYVLTLDLRMALSDDLLLYTDKLSMQHSLEVRVPYLDVDLMRFVESLPTKFKSTFFTNKILHKKLAEKYLPKEIIYRKKKGFYVPRKEWYKTESGKVFRNAIMDDNGVFSKLFNKNKIVEIFDKHISSKYNYEDQIYSILNLFYCLKSNNKE